MLVINVTFEVINLRFRVNYQNGQATKAKTTDLLSKALRGTRANDIAAWWLLVQHACCDWQDLGY